MKACNVLRHLLSVPVVLVLAVPAAADDEIPIQAIQNWNFYNTAGWRFLNSRQYDKAEDRFRRAIAEIRPFAKKDMRLMARSYADLARVLYHKRRYADAEPLAEWALKVRESQLKANPDAIFQSLYTLALIHVAQDHFNHAEPLLRRALEIQEQQIGESHVQTAATLDELAGVCAQQRKFHDAEPLYRRALLIYQRFDPEHNLDLAACAEHFAAMLEKMDRRADAETQRKRAKSIRDVVETKAAHAKDTRTRPEFKGFK